MSFFDFIESVPRRTMTLFFLIDTSGSMAGNKIGAVNDAIVNVLPMLEHISSSNPDAEIKVAALEFSNGTKWFYNEPKLVDDFKWIDVKAGGLTSLGEACIELNSKLSRSGYMKSASGSYAPIILLLSGSSSTDNFDNKLQTLQENKWFKHAFRIAIAIGDDVDLNVLSRFTGNSEAVVNVKNIDALKQIIRIVFTSLHYVHGVVPVGGTSKHDRVIEEINQAVDDINGASIVATPNSTSYDNWD
ncbi:VWA domain-containing protein [Parabacteroides sp. OttesenSCG-928-J18]|nr:VWA domain-containing protein [Parabacteroides sp. OttesenSCG-928-J18]